MAPDPEPSPAASPQTESGSEKTDSRFLQSLDWIENWQAGCSRRPNQISVVNLYPLTHRCSRDRTHSLKCCPIFAMHDNSLSASRRSSVTSATHTSCKLPLRRLRCGVFLYPQRSEQTVKFVRPFVDIRYLAGVRSTYASVAIRRPRYGNRQI
jgi:hypothetical protein